MRIAAAVPTMILYLVGPVISAVRNDGVNGLVPPPVLFFEVDGSGALSDAINRFCAGR